MNTPARKIGAQRLDAFGTTIFTEMTLLAMRHQAVNLGQGFPDFDGPDWLLESACKAIRSQRNQYARTYGLPELNRAIAQHQHRHYGAAWDPETEITVTAGATEALFASFQALCDPGDEVILFEPFYDSYLAGVTMAGAVPRVVTLRPPSFGFDLAELERAFSPRTRAVVINTPHNPTGHVFGPQELEALARLCRQYDVIAISDEVYEHLIFEGSHLPIASLPEMRDRSVTISSAGKTFSVTGWKIGWACAAPEITRRLRIAHQFVTFCNGTPFQLAIAEALGCDDQYFEDFRRRYRERRDRLSGGLTRLGLQVYPPQGTYFVVVDTASVGEPDGDRYCRELPARCGVAAIPCSAFYWNQDEGRSLVRFAFCKTDAVIDAGLERLARWSR
jgi:N-succinyldiaminopimelate aminotransferase